MRIGHYPRAAGRRSTSFIGAIGLGVVLLGASGLLGLITAVFPPGFVLRIAILPLGVGFVLVAWAMRDSRATLLPKAIVYLLLATVALSVLWPRYIHFSLGVIHVSPQTITAVASLGAVMFWLIYSPRLGAAVREYTFGTAIGVLIVIWFAWRLLAALAGEHPMYSTIDFVRESVYLASFFLIGIALVCYDHGEDQLHKTLISTGLVVALIGLLEALMQQNVLVQFARGDAEAADSLSQLAVERIRDGGFRAQSVFSHPISFGQFIAAVLPLGMSYAIYGRRVLWRLMALSLVPIGILALVTAGSRASLVSLAAACLFGGLIVWLRAISTRGLRRVLAVLAIPAFLSIVGMVMWLVSELVQGRTAMEVGSTGTRLLMIERGIQALWESPIWGFGQGMAIGKAGLLNSAGIATIDSYWLSVALDSGYVGLLIFIGIVGLFSYQGTVAAVRLRGADGFKVGMIVASVLAIFATFAGLSIVHNMTLLWLLIAMGLPYIRKARAGVNK